MRAWPCVSCRVVGQMDGRATRGATGSFLTYRCVSVMRAVVELLSYIKCLHVCLDLVSEILALERCPGAEMTLEGEWSVRVISSGTVG